MSRTVDRRELEDILRRLDALETGQDTPQDSLSPNYLTLSPGGLIGALFPGGVQIPEQLDSLNYNPATALGFVNADVLSAVTIASWILGWVATFGRAHHLDIQMSPGGVAPGASASVNLQARDPATGISGSSLISVSAVDPVNPGVTRTLLKSDGTSSFVGNSLGSAGGPGPRMGDPAAVYLNGNAALAANVPLNLFSGLGALSHTVLTDPGGRINAAGDYVCRNTGTYQMTVSATVQFGAGGGTLSVAAQNAGSGTQFEADNVTGGTNFLTVTITAIIPATAGDILRGRVQTNANATLLFTGIQAYAATVYSVVQLS